jgi:hypothetical protein
MLETNLKTAFDCAGPSPSLDELIEQMTRAEEKHLRDFLDRVSRYEDAADEMLTKFADAVEGVKSISLPQFDPAWQINLLKVVQELYRLPRWIFCDYFPEEYKQLKDSYLDFVMESEAMGEDMLEFLISIEKHGLDDARDLFDDLTEGLEKLETLLTNRWRQIGRLARERASAESVPNSGVVAQFSPLLVVNH